MDVSEYDAMRENKRLLEASLEKEREYKKEIDRLNEEKIKALEDARMKVVKVYKKETHEHALIKNNNHDIYRELCYYFSKGKENLRGQKMPHFPGNYNRSDSEFLDWLFKVFFSKEQSVSVNTDNETVTTHGLDEIKVELREDIESQIDKETKDKLKYADTAIKRYTEILSEKKAIREDFEILRKRYDNVLDSYDKLQKDFENVKKTDLYENTLSDDIKEILNKGYNFWNAIDRLNDIKHATTRIHKRGAS